MKKLVSLLMVLAMVLSFAAIAETAETEQGATIVYATSAFGQKFSPFFATTAYDMEVVDLTNGYMLSTDRGGNVIRKGIEGEVVEYNGTEYTYYSMADVEVVQNDDGTVDYNLTMRDDMVFSDGTPITIDDYIFSLYVLADPTYDGSSTIYALRIEGMEDYYSGMSSLGSLLIAAGPDNSDFSNWSEETQKNFWEKGIVEAGAAFAQEIVDYCVANYANDYAGDIESTGDEIRADAGLAVKFGMVEWGFEDAWFEGATAEDYWKAIYEAYEGDVMTASDTESAGSSIMALLSDEYKGGVSTADDVKSISGVIRTGDYSCTIHMTEYDATAIYNIGIQVAPLNYYGNVDLYDYENESFGFVKGDLGSVRAHTSNPEVGCGPFVFTGYENGVVTLKANENYFLGKPAAETLLMQEAIDSDFVPGTVTGTFDLSVPSISDDVLNAICDANGGELVGDVLTTYLIDYRGYGYMGINANEIKVGEDSGSEESKNLRKGIMTLLSVYRDTVINSYYGDRASVIQYPISNTSWAAPRPTDEGYQLAYSVGVDGQPIYTEGMSAEQKYEAAFNAAVEYIKAAGYEWDGEKFTAAPEGASMTYEVMIPGSGIQDHPAYGVAVAASEALAKVGITLQVNDVGTSTWNNALEGNTAQIWAAAWQSTADPDMYQVYHSRNANGENTNSNHYQIVDEALDNLIIAGRTSADNDFRKATYKSAMEIIMDWGVELPLYQRKDCIVTSTIRVDNDTMPADLTPYYGWYAEVEKLAAK